AGGGLRRDGRGRGLRQVGPVEPGLAVHVRSRSQLPPQRAVGACGDRDVSATGELEHLERVAGGLLQRLVAGDGRDTSQLDLGRGEREQNRDRVVVAGVAVDDDGDVHRSASTSSAVGRDVCAPKREAASAPAAQARRSASSRLRPSSSETTRQAVKASPAPVPSTASTFGGAARATSSPPSSRIAPSAPSVTAIKPSRWVSASSS